MQLDMFGANKASIQDSFISDMDNLIITNAIDIKAIIKKFKLSTNQERKLIYYQLEYDKRDDIIKALKLLEKQGY